MSERKLTLEQEKILAERYRSGERAAALESVMSKSWPDPKVQHNLAPARRASMVARLAAGESYLALSKEFGIQQSAVYASARRAGVYMRQLTRDKITPVLN